MTLEATLERIAIALETIAKQGGTVAQATAELGKPEAPTPAPAPAKGKGKKEEVIATSTPDPAAPAASPTATQAAPSDAGPTWEATLAKVMELNKGTAANQGRAGVLALLSHYGLDPAKGQSVPALQPLNKNAEIIAFCDNLLKPAEAAAPAAEVNLF